jgi:hypothetical protein
LVLTKNEEEIIRAQSKNENVEENGGDVNQNEKSKTQKS